MFCGKHHRQGFQNGTHVMIGSTGTASQIRENYCGHLASWRNPLISQDDLVPESGSRPQNVGSPRPARLFSVCHQTNKAQAESSPNYAKVLESLCRTRDGKFKNLHKFERHFCPNLTLHSTINASVRSCSPCTYC
jgi:hypothetical protein